MKLRKIEKIDLTVLEQEVGAVFVAEPMYFRYNAKELAKVDPSKPLEALARFCMRT